MAVDDDVLHKNSFDFELATVVMNDRKAANTIQKKGSLLFWRMPKSKYISNNYLGS